MVDFWVRFIIGPVPDQLPVYFLFDILSILVPLALGDQSLESTFLIPSLGLSVADGHQVRDTSAVLICSQSAEGDFRWGVTELCVRGVEFVMDELREGLGLWIGEAFRGAFGHCRLDDFGEFFDR